MKRLSTLLAFSLLLCGLAIAQNERNRPPEERITHGPVVEATGTSWAMIAWSTDTGGSSIVRYGTAPNRLSQTAEAPYANNKRTEGQTHRVRIENLRPGTTYFYIVDSGQGEGTGTEARSRVEQFTTKR
jgi:phosphodiesterase/alkaline phosphatase D-like protein